MSKKMNKEFKKKILNNKVKAESRYKKKLKILKRGVL